MIREVVSILPDDFEWGSQGYDDYALVDPETEEVMGYVPREQLEADIAPDGTIPDDYTLLDDIFTSEPTGFQYPVFLGGSQVCIPVFRGGSQVGEGSESDYSIRGEALRRSEIEYLESILGEVFDGRNDLKDLDKRYLLDMNTGMPQTLWGVFINRPGDGGGRSSIRHIFRGDNNGGLHVPSFVTGEKYSDTMSDFNLNEPFQLSVTSDGAPKIKIIKDENGDRKIIEAKNSMFPIALDSLAVMQYIIDAWQNRKTTGELQAERPDRSVYHVPVGDMVLKLVTDTSSRIEKVRTAFPLVSYSKS